MSFRRSVLGPAAGLEDIRCHRRKLCRTRDGQPLQSRICPGYQKRVRLLHARFQLIASQGSATSVAYGVGYESPNQFSREYAPLLGLPPSRDLAQAMNEVKAA